MGEHEREAGKEKAEDAKEKGKSQTMVQCLDAVWRSRDDQGGKGSHECGIKRCKIETMSGYDQKMSGVSVCVQGELNETRAKEEHEGGRDNFEGVAAWGENGPVDHRCGGGREGQLCSRKWSGSQRRRMTRGRARSRSSSHCRR